VTRTILFRYQDPLDVIWEGALRSLGAELRRSREVYAAWDGLGTLTLADRLDFDADDSLAQLIFHELCHWLVSGEQGGKLPDWGLDNTSERDLVYEHACHRLQAALSQPYGLRDFFAVTTEWRPYWDALPADPLADTSDPALPLARAALQRAASEPFHEVLHDALRRTALIADIVRAATLPTSLWGVTRARHASGYLLTQDFAKRCGTCAWGAHVRGKLRCRQTKPGNGFKSLASSGESPLDGLVVNADGLGCERWEPKLEEQDCGGCGACCHRGFDVVDVSLREPFAQRHPELIVIQQPSGRGVVPRPAGNCVALRGTGNAEAPFRCAYYEERPKSCRDFPVGEDACLIARKRAGISP
jgi:hypothetical protein